MKKILLLTTIILFQAMMSLQAQNGSWGLHTVAFDASGGKGNSEANPILIEEEGHLAYLAEQVNLGYGYLGKYFRLEKDLDLSEHYWVPIGKFDPGRMDQLSMFRGSFDGNKKKIKGLYIKGEDVGEGKGNAAALFGSVYAESITQTIKDLTLESGKITEGAMCTASLIGFAHYNSSGELIIENCHNAGVEITGGTRNRRTDGFADYNNTGGLVAYNWSKLTMKNCINAGKIMLVEQNDSQKRQPPYTGGLLGYNLAIATIISCGNTGEMEVKGCNTSTTSYIGGLIGRAGGETQVKDCYNSGPITAEHYSGGLIGETGQNDVSLTGCYNIGNITGLESVKIPIVGGLIGYAYHQNNSKLDVSNCYSYATLSVGDKGYVGGLAGYLLTRNDESRITISDSYATGKITGLGSEQPEIAGGLIGVSLKYDATTINPPVITNCVAAFSTTIEGQNVNRVAGAVAVGNKVLQSPADDVEIETFFGSAGNYAYVRGFTPGPALKGLNGADWNGKMDEEPIAGGTGWNSALWKFDNTHKLMPLLNGFSVTQRDIPNPNFIFNLEFIGMKGLRYDFSSMPEAYPGASISFGLILEPEYSQSQPVVMIEREGYAPEQLDPDTPGTYAYTILNVQTDITVTVEGIEMNPSDPSEPPLPPAVRHTLTVDVAKGIKSNYSNGTHGITAEGGRIELIFSIEDPQITVQDIVLLIDDVETAFRQTSDEYTHAFNLVNDKHSIRIALRDDPSHSLNIDNSFIMTASDGSLIIESASPVHISVYTPLGRQVAARSGQGYMAIPLEKGIYLVKVGDKVSKINVR